MTGLSLYNHLNEIAAGCPEDLGTNGLPYIFTAGSQLSIKSLKYKWPSIRTHAVPTINQMTIPSLGMSC